MPKNKEIVLIIHNVRSALNVGSMFRTADGVGVSKIYVCGYSPTPDHPKVAKTSLGAEKTVPWEQHRQTWRLLEKLRASSFQLLALEQAKKSKNIFKLKALSPKPLALLVGNEVRGLSQQILKYCDAVVDIPMYGKKESLNVSVAAGIALYALKNSS